MRRGAGARGGVWGSEKGGGGGAAFFFELCLALNVDARLFCIRTRTVVRLHDTANALMTRILWSMMG